MKYEQLRKFILEEMLMEDGHNYQPVMIRALNQNHGILSKEKIIKELQQYNSTYPISYFNECSVFDVLQKRNVVQFNSSKNTYELLDYDEIDTSFGHKAEITKSCDKKIFDSKTKIEIKKFSDVGVSDKIQKALLWYWKRRGKTYNRDTLSKPNKDGFIDEDYLLDEDQRLHGMVKGVYKAKGEDFAQAITLNPKSKWGMELKPEHPTIRIDYDFKDPKKYSDQISWIKKIRDSDLPLGVAFCIGKNKWRILGLCKIKKQLNDTTFRLEHWGISDEESKKLKDDAISDYDRYHILPQLKKYQAINWSEFFSELQEIKQIFTPKNMSSDKKNISNILYEVSEGDWVLPEFQRFFEWKPSEVSDFLESIFRGYYVGSFLLWDVEESDKEECETFPIESSEPKESSYNMIILDGQQRITSLHYAITAPEKTEQTRKHPGYFYIDCRGFLQNDEEKIIVRTEKKISDKDTFDRLLFPLYYLEKPDDWINDLRDFLKNQNNYLEKFEVQIFNPIREKTTKMKDFEIPIIYLKRIPFDVVSTIFEKVNTKGKRLEVFDLMNNRMSGYGVRLRKLWTDTESKFPLIKTYDEKMETKISRYIMESISLSYTILKSCKKIDILDMFSVMQEKDGWTPEKFNQMWNDVSEYVNIALAYLEDKQKGFGVPAPSFLPYEPMLPVLVSLIQKIKNDFKNNETKCEQKLRQWYWTSVFGERYSQGVEGKKSSDYKSMTEWFRKDENIPKYITDFQKNYQRILLEDITRSKSAIYRGVMCLIMKKGAVDTEIRFSPKNKQHMDHIFPKSKLTQPIKNSILNMTWLTDTTNISKTNKMPKEYYTDIKKKNYDDNEPKLLKILSSHLISKEAYGYLVENNFDEFIESRRKEILKAIANEIDVDYVDEDDYDIPTQTSKNTPFGNRVVLRNAIESCNKELIWVSRWLGSADLKTLYIIRKQMNVNKIRLLTSKTRADENLKSDFKSFRKEMSENHGIECEMRVMSKDVEEEQHARYLADSDKCYNSIDTETAQRGQSDDVSLCQRPSHLEKWWETSYDIFQDWNKFQ